ncbi:HAMP domain-containing histidine kinase [Dyella sp. LX-66]|uniref:sensor histidine kinase n=1 Tax=unclassified Dyella TaxID=2634549 RepID=UPI001BDFDBD4|nr:MULTISPECIES: HAMP domain-containing sensor histidine kinase [unclassified Dyella]MBT2118092.1 HAMP domain-containing histidine kinase [Dyella sp. LX-1]MBT2140999.1 HAMP domain-containing histidine kinase [Dyella sp. LX-66]
MGAKNKSLTAQLAWRLMLLQILIILGIAAAITYTIADNGSYIVDSVPETIERALHVDASGQLVLRDSEDMRALLRDAPELWFSVEDGQGRKLQHGGIPAAYRPLLASLSELQASEIHIKRAPYALSMRVFVADTASGKLHIMCGGLASNSSGTLFMLVVRYLGWRMTLPLALLTLIVMPLLIRRAMSGVAEVAEQAQAIDIDERGARLADHAVAREFQPLVQAFNAALARLNEGYDARDRFLADAAHELRAPIAILEARIGTLEAGATRTRLLTDVARLSNLAEQLLDLQRLGRQQGVFEPLDLVALASEVAADAAPLAVDAGYDMALDAPQAPVMVLGDRLSLSRALNNLVQNAIAHGGGSGLIGIGVNEDGTLGVTDQGPGVPADERHRVFEPFYRLRPSSTGAGLGLHLVQEIVALHGGRIEVSEAPGGGACFLLRLKPLQAARLER